MVVNTEWGAFNNTVRVVRFEVCSTTVLTLLWFIANGSSHYTIR